MLERCFLRAPQLRHLSVSGRGLEGGGGGGLREDVVCYVRTSGFVIIFDELVRSLV